MTTELVLELLTEAVEAVHGTGHLEHVVLRDHAVDRVEERPADGLFVMIGAVPDTDWLPAPLARDERGFVLTGATVADVWQQDRQPLPFETSLPGVFAVGDVRAGSVKRVASAVGEGSVCVWQVHQFLAATQPTASAH